MRKTYYEAWDFKENAIRNLGSVLYAAFFICILFVTYCSAEKIYFKDGRVANTQILYRSKGSIWCKSGVGAVGIDMQDISRIENDDGTISKYGYNFVSGAIPDLIAQHNYTEAARLCGLLLNASPDNVRIRYLRGLLNQKTGELEQAAQDYDFLIKRGVADAEILNNAGTIYANNKDFEKAEGFFIAAIKKNPGMIEAHNNLADLFLQTEDYSRAIEEYNKVTQKEPENTRALYNLGIAYMKSGKHLIAKEQWEKVLAIKPEDGEAKKALEYLNTKKL